MALSFGSWENNLYSIKRPWSGVRGHLFILSISFISRNMSTLKSSTIEELKSRNYVSTNMYAFSNYLVTIKRWNIWCWHWVGWKTLRALQEVILFVQSVSWPFHIARFKHHNCPSSLAHSIDLGCDFCVRLFADMQLYHPPIDLPLVSVLLTDRIIPLDSKTPGSDTILDIYVHWVMAENGYTADRPELLLGTES